MESYIKYIHSKYNEILKLHPNLSIPDNSEYTKKQDSIIIQNPPSQTESFGTKFKCEKEGEVLNFLCPHCEYFTQVPITELNCRIFRHGYFVQKNEKGEVIALLNQISPHESESSCETLRNNPNISGCCRPFRIDGDESSGYFVNVCGYI